MSDLIGKTVGQYQIIEQIGLGGMATVFKAYQPSIDRYVAVKILPSQFAQDPNFVKRFQQEAKAIAALEHPHILPVHDFGTEGDRYYMVMRYVEGGTLGDLMGQTTPDEQIVQIVGNIARALHYAHQQGVVHRDIKPSNILIDQHGEALLTDFGIAKMIEGSGATQLTSAGSILGTPAYMAPEQAEAAKIDGRSDIYSLGVVLYELLTGRPPYQAETPLAVALMHINEPLPPPRTIKSNIPEPLERVVLKAMAKDPDHRFQTAGEMERVLRQSLKEIDSASPTVDTPAPATQIGGITDAVPGTPTKSGRSALAPFLIGGGILALLLCLVGGGIAIWAIMASPDEVAEATPTTSGLVEATIPVSQEATPAPESAETSPPTVVTEGNSDETIIDIEGLDGAILFEDRFDSDQPDWFVGRYEDQYGQYETAIADGRYRMSLSAETEDGNFAWEEPAEADFDDFVLSVDTFPVEQNSGSAYGLTFRNGAGEEFYTFEIENDGFLVQYTSFDNDQVETLVDFTEMAAIRSNGPNQLVVKANGPFLSFYINGQEAIAIEDDTLASGSVGLFVDIFEAGASATVEFDNLVVREISDEERVAGSDDDILFEEYFDSNANGWPTGKFEDEYTQDEVTIENGQYRLSVTARQAAYVEKTLPDQEFSDFILTLDATPHDTEEHYSFGVAFRENDDGHSYTFEIGNDGLYSIFLFDGEWETLAEWSSTDAIEAGQTNEIVVIAEGSTLAFFVNDEELTVLEDDTFSEGAIGLILEIFEEGKSAAVDFDNLVIWPGESEQ